MRIVVLAKHVPNPSGSPPELAEDGFRLRRDQPDAALDPSDEPGVEIAVRLAGQTGGDVTVVSMGPPAAIAAVWRALALGAHRGVLVSDDPLAGADALATARVLAAVIARSPFDLVVAGVESTDGATGTMPMALAELLDLPAATFARRVTLAGGRVSIERQTGYGHDVVECALPALVTVTAGAADARYASVREAIQAKKKPVERLSLGELGLSADDVRATHHVTGIEIAAERQAGDLVDDAGEAVARIVELLREAEVV
jgi:electron transfer flavoprotein beta subunit